MVVSRGCLIRAVEAGSDGRIAEEVAMLEALVAKDDKQASSFFDLFQRYHKNKNKNTDKVFAYLEMAVTLLVDPNLVEASDPQSVDLFLVASLSDPLASTMSSTVGHIIWSGASFIEENRVVGGSG